MTDNIFGFPFIVWGKFLYFVVEYNLFLFACFWDRFSFLSGWLGSQYVVEDDCAVVASLLLNNTRSYYINVQFLLYCWVQLSNLLKCIFIYFSVCEHVCACMCVWTLTLLLMCAYHVCTCVEVRGKLVTVSSLLSACGFQGWNSGNEAWQQQLYLLSDLPSPWYTFRHIHSSVLLVLLPWFFVWLFLTVYHFDSLLEFLILCVKV